MPPAADYRYVHLPRTVTRSARSHRPLALLLAVLVAAGAVVTAGAGPVAARDNGCARWTSTVTPPPVIRVLREGRILRVPFRLYVARVAASEWGHSVPQQLSRAGAVAVRQYAWYKAMHPRRSAAGCYAVHADTRDQIYRPRRVVPERIWAAVDSTWSWRMLRQRRITAWAERTTPTWLLFQTGYRTGTHVGCARDADGWHLYARSGRRCAALGWSAQRILLTYYHGRLLR